MRRVYILSFLFFIAILLTAAAKTNYTEPGFYDAYYQAGDGILFNMGAGNEPAIKTKVMQDAQAYPLVGDLDGDGISEIVVIDDDTVRIFEADAELTEMPGLAIGSSRFGNMILYDIDDDGYVEILIPDEYDELIRKIQFNGTDTINDGYIDVDGITAAGNCDGLDDNPNFWIKCGSPNYCILLGATSPIPNDNYECIVALGMNSTNVSSAPLVLNEVDPGSDHDENLCFPAYRSMTYSDYDADGTYEYNFDYIEDGTSYPYLHIANLRVDYDPNMTVHIEEDYSIQNIGGDYIKYYAGNPALQDHLCSNISMYFTSPIFDNFKVSTQNEESYIGFTLAESYTDQFKMCIFEYQSGSWSVEDCYPEVLGIGTHADGKYISNLFEGHELLDPDDDGHDVCMLGYLDYFSDDVAGEDGNRTIDLLCANYIGDDSYQFIAETSDYYSLDMTGDPGLTPWYLMAHSAQQSSDITYEVFGDEEDWFGSTAYYFGDTTEILTPFGMFKPSYAGWDFLEAARLDLAPFGYLDAATVLISSDAKKLAIPGGGEDLIALRPSNLFYYDDKRSNSPASITNVCVNPCFSAPWAVNTTAEITVQVTDPDEDEVSARGILYYGNDNAIDSGWIGNYSSGTIIPLPYFPVNMTVGSGKIRVYSYDTAHVDDDEDYKEFTFQVSNTGLEFGDCNSCYDYIIGASLTGTNRTECSIDEDCPSGFLCVSGYCTLPEESAASDEFGNLAGLFGLSKSILAIFIMFGFAIAIWFAPIGTQGNFFDSVHGRFGMIAIGEMFMLIIGAMLHLISPGIIITIVVLVVLGILLWLASRFTHAAGGGG